MQKNGKCKSCAKRVETVYNIINECRGLALGECKTWYDRIGMVFAGDFCLPVK